MGAEPPDTWEDIQKVSEKVKKAGVQEYPNGFPWNRTGDGYDPAMSLLWSYGAAWVDKSGKFTGIPKTAGVEALKVVTRAHCPVHHEREREVAPRRSLGHDLDGRVLQERVIQ